MNRFAELLDRLAYEPGRNNKLRLITAYFRDTPDPDRGYALAALTGALSFKHAKPGLIRDLIAERTDPVLFGLSYDYVGDLSETVALMWPQAAAARPQQPTAADALRGRHHASHARQDRAAGAARALARRTRRDRPLGAAQARHRRDAHRRLGAARQDRRGRARRQGPARDRTDLARARAALSRPVRLAGRPRRQAGQPRSRAVPPGDAGACDRGYGFRQPRSGGLHRRMEMGRHPRAGGLGPRRARPHAGAALFAHRRGHFQELSRPRAVAASARRHRRRTAGAARGPRADLQRAAAAAQPQSRLAEADQGISDPSARLRSARRRRERSARTAVRRAPRAARDVRQEARRSAHRPVADGCLR